MNSIYYFIYCSITLSIIKTDRTISLFTVYIDCAYYSKSLTISMILKSVKYEPIMYENRWKLFEVIALCVIHPIYTISQEVFGKSNIVLNVLLSISIQNIIYFSEGF